MFYYKLTEAQIQIGQISVLDAFSLAPLQVFILIYLSRRQPTTAWSMSYSDFIAYVPLGEPLACMCRWARSPLR